MIDLDRADIQMERILALAADERTFALLRLRDIAPDALDEALTRAEEFKAERATGGRS